jgi:hypothetical protein
MNYVMVARSLAVTCSMHVMGLYQARLLRLLTCCNSRAEALEQSSKIFISCVLESKAWKKRRSEVGW